MKLLLELTDEDAEGVKKIAKLYIDLYDKAQIMYDCAYRILKSTEEEESISYS